MVTPVQSPVNSQADSPTHPLLLHPRCKSELSPGAPIGSLHCWPAPHHATGPARWPHAGSCGSSRHCLARTTPVLASQYGPGTCRPLLRAGSPWRRSRGRGGVPDVLWSSGCASEFCCSQAVCPVTTGGVCPFSRRLGIARGEMAPPGSGRAGTTSKHSHQELCPSALVRRIARLNHQEPPDRAGTRRFRLRDVLIATDWPSGRCKTLTRTRPDPGDCPGRPQLL